MNKKDFSIADILNRLVGQKVSACQLGHGSMFSIDLGILTTEHIPTKKRIIKSYMRGEWHLWVSMCAWRIDKDNKPLIAADDEREIIAEKLQLLVGTTLTQYEILNTALDTKFYFDSTISLILFNMNTQNAKQWMLFTPKDKVLIVGPADAWRYESTSRKIAAPLFDTITPKNTQEEQDTQEQTALHRARKRTLFCGKV